MKSAALFIAFLGLLTVSSCSPSAEEVRQQQEAIIKKKYEDKAALENSLKDFQSNLKNLKNSLV